MSTQSPTANVPAQNQNVEQRSSNCGPARQRTRRWKTGAGECARSTDIGCFGAATADRKRRAQWQPRGQVSELTIIVPFAPGGPSARAAFRGCCAATLRAAWTQSARSTTCGLCSWTMTQNALRHHI